MVANRTLLLASALCLFTPSAALQGATPTSPFRTKYSRVIPPLLQSKWGQSFPFNFASPKGSDGKYYRAGCVAVALGQILYHHRWPERGMGSHSYVWRENGSTREEVRERNFASSVYDWANMRGVYSESEIYTRIGGRRQLRSDDDPLFTSVSQLIGDIGLAVNMNYQYGYSGSTTYLAQRAAQTHFGYHTSALLSPTTLGWEKIDHVIQQELEAGYPIYVSGGATGSQGIRLGHAWVIDGMNSEGKYHMNFGWEGQSDGYYDLRNIQAGTQGTEFSGRRVAFSQGLTLLLLRPMREGVPDIAPEYKQLKHTLSGMIEGSLRLAGGKSETQRTRSIAVEFSGFRNDGSAFSGDYGYGIYNQQGKLVRIQPSHFHDLGGFTAVRYSQPHEGGMMRNGSIVTDTLTDLVNLHMLPEGSYTLRPMSSAKDDGGNWDQWRPMLHAPILRLRLQEANIVVLAESGLHQGFQLTQVRPLPTLHPGDTALQGITLRNLTGLDREISIQPYLISTHIGSEQEMPLDGESYSFTAQEERLLYLRLNLPQGLPAGRYLLGIRLQQPSDATAIPLRTTGLAALPELQITDAVAPEMQILDADAVIQTSGEKAEIVRSYPVNLTGTEPVALQLSARDPHSQIGLSRLHLYLEDVIVGNRIPLALKDSQREGSESGTITLTSQALDSHIREQLRDDRIYRIIVTADAPQGDTSIWSPPSPEVYINFLTGNKPAPSPSPTISPTPREEELSQLEFEDAPEVTSTDPALAQDLILRWLSEHTILEIQGSSFSSISLYDLSGTMLQTWKALRGTTNQLNLGNIPQGIYLLRLYDQGGSSRSIKIRK